MTQPSPSELDTLTDDADQSGEGLADGGDSKLEALSGSLSPGKDTGEEASIQEKEAPLAARPEAPKALADPRGTPWVDFVPEYTRKRPSGLRPLIDDEMIRLNDFLADKEHLKLSYHNEPIHGAYLKLWVRESNRILRTLVRLAQRRRRLDGEP